MTAAERELDALRRLAETLQAAMPWINHYGGERRFNVGLTGTPLGCYHNLVAAELDLDYWRDGGRERGDERAILRTLAEELKAARWQIEEDHTRTLERSFLPEYQELAKALVAVKQSKRGR